MARKKKKGPKKKGRRMGATVNKAALKTTAMYILGGIGGVIAGRLLNNAMATMDGKIMGTGEVIVGGALVWKAKPALLKGVGLGLAANGGLYFAGSKGINILPAAIGYGPPMQYGYRSINGYREVPKIGFPKPGSIGRGQPNMESSRMARMYAGIYN